MRSSFHVNTFWHHVKWSRDGRVGKDQHGNWWYNIHAPKDEAGNRPESVDYYNEEARAFINERRVAA
jgi:hypothetical protein